MEVPTTIPEWTELFKKMKENGVEYPLSLADSGMGGFLNSNVFSSAYGISAGNFYKGRMEKSPMVPIRMLIKIIWLS